MNPKLAKFIAKSGLTVVASLIVTYTIKMEKKAEDRINEHFDNSDAQDN